MNKPWNNYYSELSEYHKTHSDCFIPRNSSQNVDLSAWALKQRKEFRDENLSVDKIASLDKLGFDWDAYGPHWDRWEDKYLELKSFSDANGHPNISQLQKGLGPWLSSQRVMYRQDILPKSRKHLLEKLGVEWSPSSRLNDRWMGQFNKVVKFKSEHGHCNVPRRTIPDPGVWVSAQRTAYRKGTLLDDRIKLLDGIGFDWAAPSHSISDSGSES